MRIAAAGCVQKSEPTHISEEFYLRLNQGDTSVGEKCVEIRPLLEEKPHVVRMIRAPRISQHLLVEMLSISIRFRSHSLIAVHEPALQFWLRGICPEAVRCVFSRSSGFRYLAKAIKGIRSFLIFRFP